MSVGFIFVLSIIGIVGLSGFAAYMYVKYEEDENPEQVALVIGSAAGVIISIIIFLASGIGIIAS